jgi:ATP-binding cassette, subfamily F, member 3
VDWKERNTAAKWQAIPAPDSQAPAAASKSSAPPAKASTKLSSSPSAPLAQAPALKHAPANSPPINREAKKELQKQQRLFQELEEKIASLAGQKIRLEASLADPSTYSDKNKFVQAETDYKKVGEEWSAANKQYEQVFEKIMELEKTI